MQRMAGMDAAFLYLETPTMHMHVVGVLVLDPTGLSSRFGIEKLMQVMADRIHLIPPLRRRVLPPPASIDHPLWIEDPEFDLSAHIRPAPIKCPVRWARLEQFVGEVASRPLDRDRPLWEMWMVDSLEDGTVAVVTKLHHSLMDGGAGRDLMASIFDLEADAGPIQPPAEPWIPDAVPSRHAQVASAVTSLVTRQKDAPVAVAHALSGLAGTTSAWLSQRAAGSKSPLTAPRTRLNGPITPSRSVSLTRVDLDTVREIRRAFGTTINDVVLAASGTALRRYLEVCGPLPARNLIAAVPVTPRDRHDDGGLRNRVSMMMVDVPLEPDDPVERLLAVHANSLNSKALQSAFGPELLQELTGFAAPSVMTAGARLYSGLKLARYHRPVFNLVISNVPGPSLDLYCAGAKVTGIFPMGPVIEGTGVNMTVLSEAHHLNVGIMACPDLVPDVGNIGAAFVEAVGELQALADGVGHRKTRATKEEGSTEDA
jgi:diacylglycerol O-acyltransferase / wax synthase